MNEATLEYYDEAGKRTALPAGLDLHVVDGEGRRRRFPVAYTPFRLGSASPVFHPDAELEGNDLCALLEHDEGRLSFTNHSVGVRAFVNRAPVDHAELYDGDVIQLGGSWLRVEGLPRALATLEGYTGEHAGQRWVLREGANRVGRSGKRPNEVELADGTVSRAHATLTVTADGAFIEADQGTALTRVNAQDVPVGETRSLSDGDLLQFARQQFRFRLAQSASAVRRRERTSVSFLAHGEAPSSYQQVLAELHRQKWPEGSSWLPFLGEEWTLEGPLAVLGAALEVHGRLRSLPGVQVSVGAHTEPGVAPALARRGEGRFLITRAAWEKWDGLVSARRFGVVRRGVPYEVYAVEEL